MERTLSHTDLDAGIFGFRFCQSHAGDLRPRIDTGGNNGQVRRSAVFRICQLSGKINALRGSKMRQLDPGSGVSDRVNAGNPCPIAGVHCDCSAFSQGIASFRKAVQTRLPADGAQNHLAFGGSCLAVLAVLHPEPVRIPVEPTVEGAYVDMYRYVENHTNDLPKALFAGNDIIAMGSIRALKGQGYKLPDDISIVGMDDMPMCQVIEPALSTIRVDKTRLGRIAVDRLWEMMKYNEKTPIRIRMGVNVVERESVRTVKPEE